MAVLRAAQSEQRFKEPGKMSCILKILSVRPAGGADAPEGEAFISYAANIMAQVEMLENIGSRPAEVRFPWNFRFALPTALGAVAVDECQDPSGAAAVAAFL